MDFSEEYRQKLVSADEAVKVIKSGDWVDYGWCTNTVDTLDKALAKRTDELKDINLRGGILLKPLAVFERRRRRAFYMEFLAYVRNRTSYDRTWLCILQPDPLFRAPSLLP